MNNDLRSFPPAGSSAPSAQRCLSALKWILALIVFLTPAAPGFAAGALRASSFNATASAVPPAGAEGAASLAPNRLAPLGPGDQVNIQVYGQPDMTTTAYVADDGTVRVPLAGAVHVAGASSVQAAQFIAAKLKSGGYFVNPLVTVTLVNVRSERVSVLGEVGKPGTYPIDPSTTVFDLLAEAGGETPNAADVIYVRRHEPDGRLVNYPIDLRGLSGNPATANRVSGSTPSQRLEGGDELYVPQAQHFYIYGEVTMPNMYKLEPGMTVIQAIARAGGVTARGSSRRIEIKRLGSDGKYEVLRGHPDDLVQSDDVIRVKQSIF
jgi:polysaccharide export outer membrane protein